MLALNPRILHLEWNLSHRPRGASHLLPWTLCFPGSLDSMVPPSPPHLEYSKPISATGPLLYCSLTPDSCLRCWLFPVTASDAYLHLSDALTLPAPVTLIPATLFHFFFPFKIYICFSQGPAFTICFILRIKIKQALALLLHGRCFIFFMAWISL